MRNSVLGRIVVIFSLYSVSLFGIDQQQQELNRLYDRGWGLLEPTLSSNKSYPFYEHDKEWLVFFPFKDYKIYEVVSQGKFYIDDVGDGIKEEIKRNIRWEKGSQELMKRYAKPETVVIDIGGHIGIHTINLSKCVGEKGSVIVFEPNQKIFRELCLNLTLNDCKNVFPIRCALGNEEGVVQMISPLADNEAAAYAIRNNAGDVVLQTLDAFQIKNISFIKIDAENMEEDILDGAVETIAANKPVMLIEILGNAACPVIPGQNKATIIKKIEDMGYTVHYLNDSRAPNDYLAIPNSESNHEHR